MTVPLFDGFPDPEPPPDPYAGLGHDARRTAKQRDMIAAGQHPATRLPLANNGRTCGDCEHFVIKDTGRRRRWFKCGKQLHGDPLWPIGTDLRKSWPACTAWAESNTSGECS